MAEILSTVDIPDNIRITGMRIGVVVAILGNTETREKWLINLDLLIVADFSGLGYFAPTKNPPSQPLPRIP